MNDLTKLLLGVFLVFPLCVLAKNDYKNFTKSYDTVLKKKEATEVLPKKTEVEFKTTAVLPKKTEVVFKATEALPKMAKVAPKKTDVAKAAPKKIEVSPKKTEVAFKKTEVLPKMAKVAPKKADVAKAAPKKIEVSPKKTEVVPKKTEVAFKKTEVLPKKAKVAPKMAKVAPKKTEVAFKKTEVLPKKAKVLPKKTERSPKRTKVAFNTIDIMRKLADVEPKATDVAPKLTEVLPKKTDVVPKMAEIPKVADVEPKATDVAPKLTEVLPKKTDVAPKMAEIPKVADVAFRTTKQPSDHKLFFSIKLEEKSNKTISFNIPKPFQLVADETISEYSIKEFISKKENEDNWQKMIAIITFTPQGVLTPQKATNNFLSTIINANVVENLDVGKMQQKTRHGIEIVTQKINYYDKSKKRKEQLIMKSFQGNNYNKVYMVQCSEKISDLKGTKQQNTLCEEFIDSIKLVYKKNDMRISQKSKRK